MSGFNSRLFARPMGADLLPQHIMLQCMSESFARYCAVNGLSYVDA